MSSAMTPVFIRSIRLVRGAENAVAVANIDSSTPNDPPVGDNDVVGVLTGTDGAGWFANPGVYFHAEDVAKVLDGYAAQMKNNNEDPSHVEKLAEYFKLRGM